MNDGNPHIIATCIRCAFRFDAIYGLECPSCRLENVKRAFRPVDEIRTALGIGLVPDAELADVWHWYQWGESNYQTEQAEIPIPRGEAAQIYELKRLFRK